MKSILRHQKLILITFAVVLLQLLYFSGKNVPVAYSATKLEIITTLYSCGDPRGDEGMWDWQITNDSVKTNGGIGKKQIPCVNNPVIDAQRRILLQEAAKASITIDPEWEVWIDKTKVQSPAAAPPPAAPNCAGGQINKLEITYDTYKPVSGQGCGYFANGFRWSYQRNRDPGWSNWRRKDSGTEHVNCDLPFNTGDNEIKQAASGAANIQPDEQVIINGVAEPLNDPNSVCGPASTPDPLPPAPPCAEWKDGVCMKVATSLFQGKNQSSGDISTDPAQFIVNIFTIILSFAGGIALLLIISAGYKIIMSKGKPEGVQQGRDQLISAIVGLVFIIFSFVIFQLIVSDIFKIPGIK